MNDILIYIGSTVIILWGIAHLIPTKNIVDGFGVISADNRKIIAMESMAEGLTLIFLGVLPLLVTVISGQPGKVVYLAAAVMLLIMAALTLFTGARTPLVWYKICPAVKTVTAALFILGAVL
jgi:hypothetical protein